MIVFNALSALFGIASAIALWMTYVGTVGAQWSIYVAFTFCLAISVYQILSALFALNLRRRLKQGQKLEVAELRESRTTNELPRADVSNLVPVTSVTENTTELLERKRWIKSAAQVKGPESLQRQLPSRRTRKNLELGHHRRVSTISQDTFGLFSEPTVLVRKIKE